MNRPYSRSELLDLERDVYTRYRLGDVIASHVPCLHEYRVKKGGRKEQHILEKLGLNHAIMDDQTCSVCFKLRTNVDDEIPILPADDDVLTKDKIDKIYGFYRWLYRHDF